MSQVSHNSPDHGTQVPSSVGSDSKASTALKPATRSRPNGLWILLSGLAISVTVLLLLAGLLVQILVVHKFYFTSNALVTSAPLGPTIAIAHACSIIVSATVPIVVGLAAFQLSRDWLSASRIGEDNRPTPFQ
jgi:hypothetical protein